MNTEIQKYGEIYLDRGFSIIPIGKNKRPLVHSWKEYQTKRATKEEFYQWGKTYPEMQLGIITGKISALVVLDIDDYKEGHTLPFEIPKTITAKTGSGGKHYYFKYPEEGLDNMADHEQKWDIRGDGGYVVAPPSWNENGQYLFLGKAEMAELPKEIIEIAKSKKKKEETLKELNTERRNFGGSVFDQLSSYDCKTGLEKLSGTRYVDMEQYSFRNRPTGGFYIDVNGKEANCWIDERGFIGSDTLGKNSRKAGPTIIQWLAWYGNDKKAIAEIAKSIFSLQERPFVFEKSKSRNSYTWGLDYIDENISTLKKRTLTILCSDENQGKTTFSFFMARKNAKKYGHRVVFYSLESQKEEMFQAIAFNYADISRIDERDETYLDNPKYLEKMKELEEQNDIEVIGRSARKATDISEIKKTMAMAGAVDLLIIDNLSCVSLTANKYNEHEAVKEIIQELLGLSQELDCPVVLVHHFRKRSNAKSELFRSTHDMAGSGHIKNLAHKIVQVARKRGDEALSDEERAEFHIREGKVRNRGGDNEIFVYYKNGTFTENF